MIYQYNFGRVVRLLTEGLQNSAALKGLKRALRNESDDDEVSIKSIIKMGIKYPLLFFSLERFRRIYRRLAYGDKFWKNHTHLKPKISFRDLNLGPNMRRFQDEESAIQQTAISLIVDALYQDGLTMHLSTNFYDPLDKLDENACIRLRDVYGYELCNGLIFESGLPIEKWIRPHSNLSLMHKSSVKSYDDLNNEGKEDSMTSSPMVSPLASPGREDGDVGGGGEGGDTQVEENPEKVELWDEEDEDQYHEDEDDVYDDEEDEEEYDYEEVRYRVPENSETEMIVFDALTNRSFAYDAVTGKRKWINQVVNEEGDIIKEFLY